MSNSDATKCCTVQQKSTLVHPLVDIATQKQQAIQQLLEGSSITKTAEIIGVDRSTVHRWLREPKFIAARNRLAKEARDASHSRLHSLIGKAVAVVENRIKAGDLKASLAVLKMTGLATAEKLDEETDEGRLIARMANELAESYWQNFLMGEKRKNLQNNPRYLEVLHDFFLELDRKHQTGDSEAFRLQDEIAQREQAAAEARRKIVRQIENSARTATLPRIPETAVFVKNS